MSSSTRHPYMRQNNKHCKSMFDAIRKQRESIKANGGNTLGIELTNIKQLRK